MEDKTKITLKKVIDSKKITEQAFEIAKKSIAKGKENEAKEIINMVSCYLKDSLHFQEKNDLINAFGAVYYSHGWLDTGARLGIFDVHNNKLFVVD